MPDPRPRILVIDDDQRINRLIGEYLAEQGWSVIVETTGEAGLARTVVERFEMVLVDLGLPGMDGLAVVRSLRRASADAPVIVMTGAATADNAIRALRHGATDFLQKPFHLRTLQEALDRAMASRPAPSSAPAPAPAAPATEPGGGPPSLSESLSTVVALLDSESPGHGDTNDAEDAHATGRLVAASDVVGEALALAPDDVRRLRWAARISQLPAGTLAGLVAIGEAARLAQAAGERWDGCGPQSLRADAIPLLARCLAVARNVAQTASPGSSLPVDDLRSALRHGAGRAFDPAVAAACLALPDESFRALVDATDAAAAELARA